MWCFLYLSTVEVQPLYFNKTMNPTVLKNEIIGYTDMLDAIDIYFDLVPRSNNTRGMIFGIGSRNKQHYPTISLEPSIIFMQFSTILHWIDTASKNGETYSFIKHQLYHMHFKVNNTHFIININNKSIVNYSQFDAHLKPTHLPIYLCDNMHDCANVTITNLNIEIYNETNAAHNDFVDLPQNKTNIEYFDIIYPKPGLKIGEIKYVLDVMRIECDITILGVMKGWNNMLQIGSRPLQRYPLLAMHPNHIYECQQKETGMMALMSAVMMTLPASLRLIFPIYWR